MTDLVLNPLTSISNRMPSWSRLGQSFNDNPTIEEAFTRVGVPQVERTEVYHRIGDEYRPVENQFALRRSDNQQVFDIVSNRYEVVQNMDLARYLEPLRTWGRVTNAGYLGNGEAVFLVVEGPKFDIPVHRPGDHTRVNDLLQFNALVYEDKRVGNALRIDLVPIRLVCVNGLIVPVYDSELSAPMDHTKGVNYMAEWVGEAMGTLGNIELEMRNGLTLLAKSRATEDQTMRVFGSAFPLPQPPKGNDRFKKLLAGGEGLESPTERDVQIRKSLEEKQDKFEKDLTRIVELRRMAAETYHGEVADQGAAGTLYGAYQAVTAVCDHNNTTKKLARSSIFGWHADCKIRAYRQCIEFSKN
jgi:hypothetical protein